MTEETVQYAAHVDATDNGYVTMWWHQNGHGYALGATIGLDPAKARQLAGDLREAADLAERRWPQ